MAGVFGELERMLVAKRLRDGRRAKAAAGGHATGATPYGWRSGKRSAENPNGALVPIPAKQSALRRMAELRESGASTRVIAPSPPKAIRPNAGERGQAPLSAAFWPVKTVNRTALL